MDQPEPGGTQTYNGLLVSIQRRAASGVTIGANYRGNCEGDRRHIFNMTAVAAEAYNVTNSLRPGSPVATFNSSIFGQINTSGDPRLMQFALKYIF